MPLEPRPHLNDVTPYVLPQTSLPGSAPVIQIASNESPFPPSPKAMAALRAISADALKLYPEGGAPSLCAALAEKHGLHPERLVFGNGSGELINLLCRAFLEPGREAIMSAFGYPYFKIAIENAGARAIKVPEVDLRCDLEGILDAVTPDCKLMFLANPNNPTEATLSMQAIRAFHQRLPDHVLLVLDEAYADFLPAAADNDSGFALADEAQNVAVLRTFSKAYCLAGLRVGWCYGPPLVTTLLNQLREASNITYEAEFVALAALQDEAYTAATKARIIADRAWFGAELAALGLTVHPSDGNFILTSVPDGRAAALYDYLRDHRILPRPMAPHGLPDEIRFSIGARADLETVVAVLKACPLL